MTIYDDAKKIIATYKFVPKKKRSFVLETLEYTIKNFDTLTILCFEFKSPKYDDCIVDILKIVTTIDELVDIHNRVAELLTLFCDLTQKHKNIKKARSVIELPSKTFISVHCI